EGDAACGALSEHGIVRGLLGGVFAGGGEGDDADTAALGFKVVDCQLHPGEKVRGGGDALCGGDVDDGNLGFGCDAADPFDEALRVIAAFPVKNEASAGVGEVRRWVLQGGERGVGKDAALDDAGEPGSGRQHVGPDFEVTRGEGNGGR